VKRVLILTDDEIELLLRWKRICESEGISDDEDDELAKKLSAAKLPA